MSEWQIAALTIIIGAALGCLWNISDKMDKIYKILKRGKDAE